MRIQDEEFVVKNSAAGVATVERPWWSTPGRRTETAGRAPEGFAWTAARDQVQLANACDREDAP
jgi:hypothetical protein